MSDKEKAWTPDPGQIRKIGDPPQPSAKEVAAMEKLTAEHTGLQESRLQILDAWNQMEDALSGLMATALGTDQVTASIVYFSGSAFPTRLKTVTSLVTHLAVFGALGERYSDAWDIIAKGLAGPQKFRNMAAHGAVSTQFVNGKNHIRLSAPMGQMHRMLEHYKTSPNTTSGYDLSQMRRAIADIVQNRDDILQFQEALRLRLLGQAESSEAKLIELAGRQ